MKVDITDYGISLELLDYSILCLNQSHQRRHSSEVPAAGWFHAMPDLNLWLRYQARISRTIFMVSATWSEYRG